MPKKDGNVTNQTDSGVCENSKSQISLRGLITVYHCVFVGVRLICFLHGAHGPSLDHQLVPPALISSLKSLPKSKIFP